MFLLNHYLKEKNALAEITPLLYQNFPIGFFSSLPASTVVFWDLPLFNDLNHDLIWFSSFLTVYLLRWGIFFWYQASKTHVNLLKYHYYLFILGSSLTACLWGILGSLFLPNEISGQMLTLLVVTAVIGASAYGLGISFIASFLYILLGLIPVLIGLGGLAIQTGQALYFVILIALLFYCFYVSIGAYRANALFLKTTLLGLEKTKLLEEVSHSKKELETIIEFSPYGIMVVSENLIRFVNTPIITMLNAENETQLLGRSFFDFIHPAYHSTVKARFENLKKKEVQNELLQEKFITLNGKTIEVNVRSAATTYFDKPAIQVFVEDISESVRSEKRISYLTSYDPLTGLVNRNKFEDIIHAAIPFAKQANDFLGIVFINLDNFKNVNDVHGLQTGDLLLQMVSKRLAENIRKIDTLSRLAGDEFSILVPFKKKEDIVLLAQKLIQLFADPFKVQNELLHVKASMGISIFPEDGEKPSTLLKKANLAMHAAKSQDGNNFKVYTKGFTLKAEAKNTLEENLRNAILNNEFFMVYQPKISLKTEKIVGLSI